MRVLILGMCTAWWLLTLLGATGIFVGTTMSLASASDNQTTTLVDFGLWVMFVANVAYVLAVLVSVGGTWIMHFAEKEQAANKFLILPFGPLVIFIIGAVMFVIAAD